MSVCRYFTHLCSPSSLFLLATSDHCAWTECNGLQPPLLLHHHNSIIKRTHLTIYINKYKYAMRGCRVWSSPLRLYYVPCVSLCCTRLSYRSPMIWWSSRGSPRVFVGPLYCFSLSVSIFHLRVPTLGTRTQWRVEKLFFGGHWRYIVVRRSPIHRQSSSSSRWANYEQQ